MSERVDRARREAEAARAQLMGDVHSLQDRLRPTNLAEEAVETVKAKSCRAVKVAQRNPLAISAGAAGVLLLIARKPIARLIGRWRSDDGNED